MPFPFIPGGALLALAVLGGAMVVFGAALKALDWTVDATRGSMLRGLVSGLRDWDRPLSGPPSTSTLGSKPLGQSGEPIPRTEEIATFVDVELEPVAPSGTHRRAD